MVKLWEKVELGGVFAGGEAPIYATFTLDSSAANRHDEILQGFADSIRDKTALKGRAVSMAYHDARVDAVLAVLVSIDEFQLETSPGVSVTVGKDSPELRNPVFLEDLAAGYRKAIESVHKRAAEFRAKFEAAETGMENSEAPSEP